MKTRGFNLALLLATTLTQVTVADEAIEAHASAPRKTIMLLGDRVQPSDLQLVSGEVVVFENDALYPIRINFLEPDGQADKIRCQRVGKTVAETAPWLLFSWDDKDRLSAIIPPGRFASVCSLAAGPYSYTAEREGGTDGILPEGRARGGKHTITVK